MVKVICRRKKGQATVEFLLLIAVLVPVFLIVISSITSKVFKPIEGWLKNEIGAQVRYGYDTTHFGKELDKENIGATSGPAPVQYGNETNKHGGVHPLHNTRAGWVQ
ncbi:MAG: hypothetical protein V1647_04215 [Pseudomonadota bacterium]